MFLKDLYNKYKDKIIYIVGTGPSLRLFPVELLASKITIGLNETFKIVNCTYNLTIHPELIPRDDYKTIWITKYKNWLASEYHQRQHSEHIYFFKNNKDIHDYEYLTNMAESVLYVGRGVHTAGVAMAAKMGARAAILVGCDMCVVRRESHSDANLRDSAGCQIDSTKSTDCRTFDYSHVSKTTNFHGLDPEVVTKEYYLSLLAVRARLPNLKILSLIPYPAAAYWKEDYIARTEPLDVVKDTSEYQRSSPDFTS